MSLHDDSSTVLSVRGSESGHIVDIQPDSKTADLPDFYAKSYLHLPSPSLVAHSEIIALDVGLAKIRYRIHRSVLAQSPELASKPALKLWGEKTHDTVALPELDAVTAHTVVAFLYTGRYEALEWLGEKGKGEDGVAAYKLAACVYCAAVRYKIPGLAELAQEKITSGGRELSIFDVLGVAREHAFPILPDDETWFPSYLEGVIKSAVGRNPGLIVKPEFVDQIEGDRKFRQVVMTAIVNTYSGGTGGGDDPPMDIEEGGGEQSKAAEGDGEDVVDDSAPPEPVAEEEREEQPSTATVDGDKEDDVQLDDIEPTIPDSPEHRPETPMSPPAPESVTDELDFKNSKTYQSMGKPPSHARHDSVVQAEESEPIEPVESDEKMVEDEEIASPPAEVASPILEGVIGTNAPSKKTRKRKGKKGGTTFA
ncbi:uncharacterized protein N0V89_011112 [Didymosphaeria variabile]|uniref:BTB domain-containing protein n=1 Tax=Didymosphaeria variabile TaxID=1932322 RepID=A0A9W8XE54_9PLEO|nr:uncharacterized protein N0V89_011112 [Didymosphaeria variabile]KAJ4347174.1 hypothetical protein N0V89_011112 [Didymosphaeria variabile]